MEPLATSSEDLPGFEAVSLENVSDETVTSEQLKSKKNQLWLIKVPFDFDISTVSDTTIVLNGTQGLSTKNKSDEKRYETRASKYTEKQPCVLNTIVPSSTKPSSLQVAKDFTGHIDILQTIQVPLLEYAPQSAPMYTEIPSGLKVRWTPFGHKSPMTDKQSPMRETDEKIHKTKHKKKRMVEELENNEGYKSSPKKRKKHKEMKKENGESSKRKKKSVENE